MIDLLVHVVHATDRLVAPLSQLRIAGLLRRRAPVEARIQASRPRVGSLTDRPLALVEGQHGALQKLLERSNVRRAHDLLQRDELVLPSTSGVLDAGVQCPEAFLVVLPGEPQGLNDRSVRASRFEVFVYVEVVLVRAVLGSNCHDHGSVLLRGGSGGGRCSKIRCICLILNLRPKEVSSVVKRGGRYRDLGNGAECTLLDRHPCQHLLTFLRRHYRW